MLRVLVYLLMALSVVILIFADKPWVFIDEITALEAEGKKLDLRHHVAAGWFYGALINLVLGAVVLCLRKHWGKRLLVTPAMPVFTGRLDGRVFWIGVTLAMLLAGGLRINLAKGSLWWDELWNVKHTMSGEFRPDMKKGGELKFRETSLEKGVYYYRKPTNHPAMTVATRLSLRIWRKVSGAARSEFNEVAVRLPSLLAGLASVGLIAVLLRSWGFGAGGLVAAFILALHPWHVRYGVDARAYSFAVLWTIFGCLWLGKIFRSGGSDWRHWILFGINQLMLVWSLPNGIYYAFAFGVAALIFCLTRSNELRAVFVSRLVGVNVVAAMMFIFLFLPNALQIGEWGEVNDHHYISILVLEDVATQLAFGLEFMWPHTVEARGLPSFVDSLEASPFFAWAAIVLCSLSLLVGAFALQRKAPRRSLLFLTVLAGAALSLLITWEMHQHFYHRYVVAYLIVPVVALIGIGSVELAKVVALRVRPVWLRAATALLVVASFAAFTREQRVVLNTRSYAPFREVAEFVEREAKVEKINVIGYGLGGRVFQIYYPESHFADTLVELDSELAAAKKRGGPVYIVCGYLQFNLTDPGSASGAAKISDEALFEEVAAYPGIDPLFYFHVMRGRQGGGADG